MSSDPNFEFPVLSAETRERIAGDHTPSAIVARHPSNAEKAKTFAAAWEADAQNPNLDEMIVHGGPFESFTRAMMQASQTSRANNTTMPSRAEVLSGAVDADAHLAEAVVQFGERGLAGVSDGRITDRVGYYRTTAGTPGYTSNLRPGATTPEAIEASIPTGPRTVG